MTYATSDERYLLTLINQTRASHGLDRLYLERHLNLAADRHSNWMLQTDTFSHLGSGGSYASERIRDAGFDLASSWNTGENIAYVSIDNDGTLTDEIRKLHQNLMDSPPHRATLLSDAYDMVGLGLQVGQIVVNGRSHTVLMLTENFASTSGQVEYDLAPGISIHTANAPMFRVTDPDRSAWSASFDGRSYRQIDSESRTGTELSGTGRSDDFRLGATDDRVYGAGGHDWISGGDGADRLRGGTGNDRVFGQNGNDLLTGQSGEDRLWGGGGADQLAGGGGSDQLQGDGGADRLNGQGGTDSVLGGAGNDVLKGEAGADRLDGGAGHDRLYGGTDADSLWGGAGNDTLYGEGGADSFVFQGNFGRDRVMDYQPRSDRLLIDDRLVRGDLEDFVQNDIRKVSSGVRIELADDKTILVAGSDLTVQQVADGIFLI